jgi:hypothetical protein
MSVMRLEHTAKLSLPRVFSVFLFGLVTGIQMALYLYDYYDDGIADVRSLWVGLVMLACSIAFILYSYRARTTGSS